MTLYDKITSQKGRLERIVARIPGFKGYQEKQSRRTGDRMLRDFIAGQLDDVINRFARIERKVLDRGGLRFMDRTRDVKTVIQTYRDRVKTAAPKYDGMFAQVKVTTEDLERIYAFDEAQIRYVDQFNAALDTLEEAVGTDDKFETALDDLSVLAEEANEAFKLRDDVLTNLSNTL